MKVLGLIEQDLDIVSKEYVDKKLKEISKSGAEAPDAPEGSVKVDLTSLWGMLQLNHNINLEPDANSVDITEILHKCFNKDGVALLPPNTKTYGYNDRLDVIKANPICYMKEADYIKYVCKTLDETRPRGLIKIDTVSIVLWATFFYRPTMGIGYTDFYEYLFGFISDCVLADGKTPVSQATDSTITKDDGGLKKLLTENPYIYVNIGFFDTAPDIVVNSILSNLAPAKNPKLRGRLQVDLASMLIGLPSEVDCKLAGKSQLDIMKIIVNNSLDSDGNVLVDKYGSEISSKEELDYILASDRIVYIEPQTFEQVLSLIANLTPVGKRKGYELMKTHYAIYLLSLAYASKGGTEGLNQKFFKLIKDGYSANEYDAEKTLVKDLGFTYNESAPESSYSTNALSNFTNKHPEIYVPTEFTDYVKGTAESTMELFGAVTNLTAFYEDHKNDPKIKIVTPNEYKINRKDPDTLYIVKES